MAEDLLQLNTVTKTFALPGGNILTAVQDVSFVVHKGTVCILL